ncbi:MAG: hypothetical protein L7H10_07210 [Vulcanisaeta sp.]|jgi:hypothetical protein|nr:hypothetical protein [Vulcanisaeta sp.]MCG2870522.1 hypothetical protein [Vulcanisaeta sp.]MCG2880693.1 hypothetical protein [Vulcanisaeta sp.]MCG2886640.1 hypothetical protein [Vulcanisaeta sp.]MCG2895724.1 hypothetical protein [Vulcanisaeta sp.]
MIDKLNMILNGLRNAIMSTVEKPLGRLRSMGVEVGEEGTMGDWGWAVISRAVEVGILNLSDPDLDAIYHVFRRCATLEEMVKDALARPNEVDENFVNNLLEEYREDVEALARVRERLEALLV